MKRLGINTGLERARGRNSGRRLARRETKARDSHIESGKLRLGPVQNILLNDALGNYRTLLQDVTLGGTGKGPPAAPMPPPIHISGTGAFMVSLPSAVKPLDQFNCFTKGVPCRNFPLVRSRT